MAAVELAILILLLNTAHLLFVALLNLIIEYIEVFVVRSSFLLGCICLSTRRHWVLKFALAVDVLLTGYSLN